ncbi:MAG: ribosomal RNA small subunit methyltransferase A [Planctomycetota bacterium]|nr:MAG: ribosomal RNA small subunit methyltransferase A [Planctomycetota bacterium]
MKPPPRQTRRRLMEMFQALGLHPRTDLGQNFLIDLNLLEYIVAQADLQAEDVALEVGAGTGSLTALLAQHAGHVVSIEVDPRMYALARAAVAEYANVTLLNCDALKSKNRFAPEVLAAIEAALAGVGSQSLKLVANLPYNIATPVVSNLVATDLCWKRMVVTVQWELALRMAAPPGDPHYGALAVWLQSQARVEILKKLSPKVFWPRPKVESAIVRIDPDPEAAARIADRAFFHDFVRRLFIHRRKFLRSVLGSMFRKQLGKAAVDALLTELNIPPEKRADMLSIEELIALSNRFHSALADR